MDDFARYAKELDGDLAKIPARLHRAYLISRRVALIAHYEWMHDVAPDAFCLMVNELSERIERLS
jgi:hypothetical protein